MGAGETIRKIAGDGISLKLLSNEQILEVTGDGCNVIVSKNRGVVRIIGDGCRLRIDQNTGDVEYTGDGGQVVLGLKSTRDRVKYVGDGGSVRFAGGPREASKKTRKGKEESGDAGKDRERTEEEIENALNDKREARISDSNREETRGRTRTSRRATVVTTVEYDEKIVKRWSANPATVVRTLNGDTFVKIVPKQSKTRVKNYRAEFDLDS